MSALRSSLQTGSALLGALQNRREVLWRPNTENIACWNPERRPTLGSAILLPPKKCSRSLSGKINDHWSPTQATRAADHCFPSFPTSSKTLITHFESLGCPSPSLNWAQGRSLQRSVLMWCLLIGAFQRCALLWTLQCPDFIFTLCKNTMWEGADHQWPLWFRENCSLKYVNLKETCT